MLQVLVVALFISVCGTPVRAQVPQPTDLGEDAAQQAMKDREKMQEQLAPLLQANPFADQSGVPAATGAPFDSTSTFGQVIQFLSHPVTQAYLRIFSQPKIQDAARRLVEHPNRKNLLYSEVALVLLMLLFRAWRLGKAKSLLGRLWIGLYSFLIATVLGAGVLPYLWLGDDFIVLGTALFEASQEAISVSLRR